MPLTNEQYESIMKKYDATRTRNKNWRQKAAGCP